MKPLCFIPMPFGQKASPADLVIDFDRVYAKLIAPAVTDADLASSRIQRLWLRRKASAYIPLT